MLIETERFGAIDVANEQVITFSEGLPGFEQLQGFVMVEDEQTDPIAWLQSTQEPAIALPVVNVFEVDEEYVLDVGDADIEKLQITSPEDVAVLVVVVIPQEIQKMTANLAAPIVVNASKNLARQVLASSDEYSVRHPIYEAVMRALERRLEHAGAVAQGE